jgi:hypothetical protein
VKGEMKMRNEMMRTKKNVFEMNLMRWLEDYFDESEDHGTEVTLEDFAIYMKVRAEDRARQNGFK